MAKRKLSLSDLSSGKTGWAQELRVNKENAKAKAKAYADDMRAQGVPVSAADEASFAYKFERGEEIDFAGPDFSNVSTNVDTTEGGLEGKLAPADDAPSFGRRVATNLFGETLGANVADAGATALESTKSMIAAAGQWAEDREAEEIEAYGTGNADVDDASLGLDARLSKVAAEKARANEAGYAGDRAAADEAAGAIQSEYEDNSLGYHAMGVSRSLPIMAAAVATRSPILGAEAIGITTAAQARSQALAEGASEEDAELAGIVQGTIEGTFDLATLGIAKYGVGPVTKKLTEKIGVNAATSLMAKIAASRIGRAGAAVGEGAITEPLTTVAQMGSEELILDKNYTGDDYMTGIRDSVVQGAAMSGLAYAGGKPGREMERRKTAAEQVTNASLENFLGTRQAAEAGAAAADADITRDLYNEQDNLRQEQDAAATAAAKQSAFEQAERDAAEERRVDEEAAFQTMERDAGLPRSRVERYGTSNLPEEPLANNQVVERVPVNAPAEISPEDVMDQEAAAKKAAEDKAEADDLAKYGKVITKETEAQKKAKEKEEKAKTSKEKAAERVRQRTAARELMAANPDMTPEELAPLLRAKLAEPAAPAETVQATPTKASIERVKPQPEIKKGPAKPDKDMADPDVTSLADQLGVSLGMQQETLRLKKAESPASEEGEPSVPTLTPYDDDAFRGKVKNIIKGLVKKNRKPNNDVQSLLTQGKLILAPNAGTIGRAESNNVAEYDPETNQMYLYTDKVGDNDTVGVLVRALHESTHAGQFNDRKGRPDIFKHMMSKDANNAAEKAIRKAAAGGNKIAIRTLEQAQAASPDATVQQLELVPYFVGEAVKARGGTLGQLRGTANDIVSAGRNFARKLGADLEVTLGDLETAAQGTAGEAAATDMSKSRDGKTLGEKAVRVVTVYDKSSRNWEAYGQDKDGNQVGDSYYGHSKADALEEYNFANRDKTLGMIGGRQGTGAADAEARGKSYKGKVDDQFRYAFSDKDARIKTGEIDRLRNGATLSLDLVLDHPELYKQYPDVAKGIKFAVSDEKARGFGAGLYSAGDNTVYIGTESLDRMNDPAVRDVILHEVQHGIQEKEGFIGGENYNFIVDPAISQDYERANENLDKAISRFELGQWQKTTDPTITKPILDEAKANKWSVAKTSEEVLKRGLEKRSTDRAVAGFGDRVYTPARNKQAMAARALNAERNRAFGVYMRNYGEAEARTTELTSNMSQEELDSRPFEDRFVEAKGNIPVEETMDTFSYGQGRRPAASAPLGMADQSPAAVKKRVIPAWFTGLFDSAQGTSKEINEAVEYARSSPAGANMIAEASLGKYDRALARMAAEQGTTVKALNEKITTELDGVDKSSNSFAANRAAFKEVVSKYGKAGEALLELRDQTDALSLEIAKARAADGNPLTETEKKRYSALLANLGRYTNRQYASQTGKVGEQYSNRVWKDYEKYKSGKGKYRTNPVIAANYKTVADATRFLVEKNLAIPDDEGLADLGADETRSLYETWGKVGNPDGLSLDAMKNELADVREFINGDKDRLNKAAEEIAKELLGLTDATSPITSFYRGGKLDKGILQERKNVPPELRKLMGEITDPSMRLLLTVGKQAEFVARNKMLMELSKHIGIDLQPPGSAGTPAADGMTKLEGELWGPLEGYYASPNMRNLIGDTIQQLATFEQAIAMSAYKPSAINDKLVGEILGRWGTVASASKAVSIVGNPANFLWNWVGANMTMTTNGNINPKHWAKAHKTSADLIAYGINPSAASKEAIRANSVGITDSAFIGEIKSGQYKQLASLIKDMSGKPHSEVVSKLRTAKVAGTELYAMMDVWAKLSNFYQQVDVLTDFYKKEGITRTPEQIDREAADITNRTNITYKRAAPMVKALERAGITQFGTYFYEVFRSQIGNMAQGVAELRRARTAKTPAGKAAMALQGARRLTGQAATWAMTGYVSQLLSAAVFGDDDEENKAKRALLPEYLRDQDFIQVGKDAKGDPVLFQASRIDPFGPMTDIMRSALNDGVSPEAVGKNMFDLYVAPRVGTQLIKAIATTAGADRPTRKPSVQQWAPDAYEGVLRLADKVPGVDDKDTKAWTNVLETFLPGAATSLRDTNVRPVVQQNGTPAEKASDTLYNAMTYSGFTMYKLDPKTQAKYAAMDYSDTLKNARKDVKEIFQDRPNVTAEEVLAKVLELGVTERQNYDKLRDIYEGMRAIGYKEADAKQVLKDNRLGEVVNDIASGQFKSRVISEDSINGFKTTEMAGKTLAEKRDIKKKWDDVWQVLEKVQGDMKDKE